MLGVFTFGLFCGAKVLDWRGCHAEQNRSEFEKAVKRHELILIGRQILLSLNVQPLGLQQISKKIFPGTNQLVPAS